MKLYAILRQLLCISSIEELVCGSWTIFANKLYGKAVLANILDL